MYKALMLLDLAKAKKDSRKRLDCDDNYGILIASQDKTQVESNQQKFNLALDK